jgi:hypothetical protein
MELISVFETSTPIYQTLQLHSQDIILPYREDRGNSFLRNDDTYLPKYTVPYSE